ncbi:hypothetical protein Glove_208g91 [Diversispora epigaea]|uniref:Uncharacterized protein n=1 Tax=Diversispora epigaea TaxID=1348612 RepID=A0A397IJC9_9GLOM|nr:hypothetical protein Glove_208g91 [Diversispora epigaea]
MRKCIETSRKLLEVVFGEGSYKGSVTVGKLRAPNLRAYEIDKIKKKKEPFYLDNLQRAGTVQVDKLMHWSGLVSRIMDVAQTNLRQELHNHNVRNSSSVKIK